jgi:hypothetical protein
LDFFKLLDPNFNEQFKSHSLPNEFIDGVATDPIYLNLSQHKMGTFVKQEQILETKEYSEKREWIAFLAKVLSNPQSELGNTKDLQLDIKWVFGMRFQDVLDSFKYYSE